MDWPRLLKRDRERGKAPPPREVQASLSAQQIEAHLRLVKVVKKEIEKDCKQHGWIKGFALNVVALAEAKRVATISTPTPNRTRKAVFSLATLALLTILALLMGRPEMLKKLLAVFSTIVQS